MHLITYEKSKIKIIFDKDISGWQYAKTDVKCDVDSTLDYMSILFIPGNIDNFNYLFSTHSKKENFQFSESFLLALKNIIKKEETDEIKRKLLRERVTLNTIEARKCLIDHKKPAPFKHQKVELEYAVRFPGFYSLDEMRLGKTRVAIERHIWLKKYGKIDKSIVICPLSLIYVWANEIKKWSDCKYLVLRGSKKTKLEELWMFKDQVDFFIINYEGITSIKQELIRFVNEKTNIILDEFIKIKNSSALRTKNCISITDLTDYVMGLCGTPVSQGSLDIFAPSRAIDKGRKFGFSYDKFKEKYFDSYGSSLQAKHDTHKEISDKLYENAIRFTRKQVKKDLPEKVYQSIPIDLPVSTLEIYNEMLNYCLAMVDNTEEITAPIMLVQLLRLSQITSGFSKNQKGEIIEFKDQPKLDALTDLIEQNNSDQLIIWSRFVRDVKAVANLCKKKNISYGCLVGKADEKYKENISPMRLAVEVGNEQLLHLNIAFPTFKGEKNDYSNIYIPEAGWARQKEIDKFQNGDTQIIIGTAQTGGLGIDLSKGEKVIYYANDYSLLNRLQSEDRPQELDRKSAVIYYDIIANSTIDISILKILRNKQKIADIVTRDSLIKIAKGEKINV